MLLRSCWPGSSRRRRHRRAARPAAAAAGQRGLARGPAAAVRGRRHRGAGRARAARSGCSGDRAQRIAGAAGPGRRQPGLAAGDQALERPRPPVLVGHHLPVRRLPGVRAGLDLRQPSRRGRHRRRPAAVALRAVRGAAGLRVPVGDLRRAGLGALAPADEPARAGPRARRRAAVRQPARARAQRAAGHGHRDAALAAPARLPALRDHRDRRQHRRRGAVAPGRGVVRSGTA